MNFKSWLQSIKDICQTESVSIDPDSDNEHQSQINVSVCKFTNKILLKDVPANKYVIIDKFFLYEDVYDRSIKKRFIFKINNDKSYKVNNIICYGSIITYEAYYTDPENEFNGTVEIIVNYSNEDKDLSLKEICNKYFQNLSLVNIKYSTSYRMTIDNIIFKQNHSNKSTLAPNCIDGSEQLDSIIQEICEYT